MQVLIKDMLSQQTPHFKKNMPTRIRVSLIKNKHTTSNHKSFQRTFVEIVGAS